MLKICKFIQNQYKSVQSANKVQIKSNHLKVQQNIYYWDNDD